MALTGSEWWLDIAGYAQAATFSVVVYLVRRLMNVADRLTATETHAEDFKERMAQDIADLKQRIEAIDRRCYETLRQEHGRRDP